jgi:glycosyltransferase involved in cell wall biosynthesis
MLRSALDAVLAQSLPPSEIIVVTDVPDPATDDAVEDARERTDVPVRLVQNTSEPGASGSRNAGARNATGEVLAFLDDDDLWAPDHLLHTTRVLVTSGAPMVIAGIEVFNSTSRSPGIQLRPAVTAIEAATRTHGVTGSNIVIRSGAFWSVDGFDPNLRHLNDRDFFYRCMLAGMTYALSPEMTARYRKHEAGQLSGASEGRARGVEAYLVKHRGTLAPADRRKLRYEIAVMRFRSSESLTRRALSLGSAAANASYPHQFRRLWKRATSKRMLSGKAFATDAAPR